MTSIAVIGAGVTGLTTAYELLARGFEVTVFDRHRYAAMETSFANGGQLSASNAETWTQWGTVLKGLKWMLQADAPLLVNPRPTLHKIGWMAEFLSNIPRYKANTVETVLGPLSWNTDGSPKGEFLVGQWQGGVSQVVLPTEVATSDKVLHWQGGVI